MVLVGIIPGREHVNNALRVARLAMVQGLGDTQVIAHTKQAASFGPSALAD